MPGDTTGKTYTYAELQTLAKNAGFSGNDVNIAAAVALAESGGNSRSYNPVGLDDSYGLWQINMKGSMGPERRKKFGISSNDELFQPNVNARAAKIIHDESGWKAWTTYTKGKYKKFLNGSTTPVAVESTDTASSVDDGSLVGGIKASVNALGENLFKTGANFAGIIAALVLLVLGVVLLARKQVGAVVPAGKIGKVAKGVLK
jgi:hypothetical protein